MDKAKDTKEMISAINKHQFYSEMQINKE